MRFSGEPAITGAIASSDRLIKDDETLSVWLKIARQVVAVETESAGICKATQGRSVPFLAIRGISDMVGFKRDPDWTAYACETAAAFAQAFSLPSRSRRSRDHDSPAGHALGRSWRRSDHRALYGGSLPPLVPTTPSHACHARPRYTPPANTGARPERGYIAAKPAGR